MTRDVNLVLTKVAEDDGFSGELADRWSEFVSCERRLEKLGPFFRTHLPANCSILDAAAGTGCDARWLSANNYQVLANEISRDLRRQIVRSVGKKNKPMRISDVNWLKFKNVFSRGEFDVVLALGNSLCLLRNKLQLLNTIRNFKFVCRESGLVIVDERNFRYIQKHRQEMLADSFRCGHSVMYCGTSIYAKPVAITASKVTFGYFDSIDSRLIGTLAMCSFDKTELVDAFESEGFRLVSLYSDLRLASDPNASFIHTYSRHSAPLWFDRTHSVICHYANPMPISNCN